MSNTGISAVWTFDSQLEAAHDAAAEIRAFCAGHGLSEVELSGIELCVYEAFVNTVEHAYRKQPGHEVRVSAQVIADQLELRVCQQGVALDADLIAATPAGFDDLPSAMAVLDCAPRGRGIRLIKTIMSRCEMEQDGERYCLLMVRPLA